jgi:Protein of unknown function (DUF2800)
MKAATMEPQIQTKPPGLTPEELDDLAYHLPHVKAWIAAVEARLTKALNEGIELKNVTLVPTQPRRYWIQEGKDLIATLRKFSKLDVVAPRTPLTPAQAEKTLGKKLFAAKLAELTVRTSSGVKLHFTHEDNEEEQ